MADITMCRGDLCSIKEQCYRFTATPNERQQSYFMVVDEVEKKEECDYFIDNK
jgi:hypothetical protein